MGGSASALNCRSKKKDKKKRKKGEEPVSPKKIQDDIEAVEEKMDVLRTQGQEVAKRVNPLDKELVDEQIKKYRTIGMRAMSEKGHKKKRKREKRLSEVRAKGSQLQKTYEVLELDLEDIQGKVDQYLAWLKKKEEQVQLTTPLGYQVAEAEHKVNYVKGLCAELENRQFTLDTVNKKVQSVLPDLAPKDREEMEKSIRVLSAEHSHVYGVAVAQKDMLTESLNTREVFQAGVDRVLQWLEDKVNKVTKLDKMKLMAADVEKQSDKAKTLMLEIEKYEPYIDQVESRVQNLQKECLPEQCQELDNTVQEVRQKYADLKTHMTNVHTKLQAGLAVRKVNEADLQKVERWCKEAEMKCAVEPSLDCATEILQEQRKQYKALDTSAQMFKSLLKEIQERSVSFMPSLTETDTIALQQSINSTDIKYENLARVIQERVQSLNEALLTRDQVGEGITEATDWLEDVQKDLKNIPRSIGPSVQDAEDNLKQYEAVAEKIANYQPTIAQLNQAVERLRSLGQLSEAEEILRITSTYEMLGDQVRQQTKKGQQAVVSRQQLEDQMKEMDRMVKECEDETDSVIGPQVPIQEKIEKLKSVSTKLQSAGPTMFKMGDKAQQIGIEGTREDAQAVSTMVDDMKARVDNLKKISDRKVKQCESAQKNHEDFEDFVSETMTWLETKEETLASCGPLDLDPHKVKSALQKHQDLGKAILEKFYITKARAEALARDAVDKMDTVKMKAEVEKTHYKDMQEPVPDQVGEKLAQINNLEDTIKSAIAKKEQYLTECSADRIQLELSMKQITDWIHGAEEMLDSGYEGLDYDTLNDTISEHKDYFSEASMCQDEMDQVMELSERLLPTLDMNDTETLRQSLKNTNQKLATVMASSQRQQTEMEKKAEEWNEYQEMVMQVTSDLHILEDEWEVLESVTLNTPSNINKHLTDTKQFIDKMEALRPSVSEINERSHDLDKDASEKSKMFIQGLLEEVNERWKNLISKTENKQMALQDLEVQYEDYSQLLQAVDQALDEAEAKIPETVDLDAVKCPELVAHMDKAQELVVHLEVTEPKITALKKCAHQLQKNLPTAEAKVQSQEIVMAMLEKYERIGDKAKEQRQLLQEEIDDREGFNTEAKQTVDWLIETKAELSNLAPSMEMPQVMERVEKLMLSEQEISIRMEQMRHMAQLQETKFAAQGRQVPKELTDQILQMNDLEKEVSTTMATKEEELLHLKANREAYKTELQIVTLWLAEAQEQLKERVSDIPEAVYRHEELVAEFEPFKKKLDNLRIKGGDLIQYTSDPIEKHTIQKTLADTNRLWSNVQAKAAEKTKNLSEAHELGKAFNDTADSVEIWIGQADAQLKAEPQWLDFDRVRDQLKQHKKLLKESDQQQNRLGHLNALVKQMEPLCDTVPQMERLADLSHKAFDVRAKTTDKANELDDVNEQIQEFECELRELKQWMDKTRAHLTMRDDTITLADQLQMQENLITDIDSHKGKALYVLEKHAELHAAVGEESRLHNTNLAAEINELLEQAHQDRDELKEAVAQQEKYESEMRTLSVSIGDAKEKLLGSPIQASSVDDLKHQIAERDELAKLIKTYQTKINDLSEKSHFLVERSSDLGPLCVRRLYHSGEHQVTVSDLMNTLHAPLEPYVSPLSSPTSPERHVSYQYENPLKVYKGEEIGPVTLTAVEAGYEPSSYVPNSGPKHKGDKHTGSSLPALSGDTDRIDPSVQVKKSSPLSSIKPISTSKTSKTDPSIHMKHFKSPHFDKQSGKATSTPNGSQEDPDFTSARGGLNSYTPVGSSGEMGQPFSDSSILDNECMEVTLQVPQQYSTPSKRSHSADRESTGRQAAKSLRSSDDSLGSVISGSTDEPKSTLSHLMDIDGADTSSSLSSHPISMQGQSTPTNRKPGTKSHTSDDDTLTPVSDEMKAFQQRKQEALAPYTPKSKYLSSKFGGVPDPGSVSGPARDDRSGSSKGPVRGEHGRFDNILPSANEESISKSYARPRESKSYTPRSRSPSPLTYDSSSRLDTLPRSRSSDNHKARSTDGLQRQSRSMSPRFAKGNEPLSKSLTSGQMRSMSRPSSAKNRLGAFSMDISRSVPSLLDPHLQDLRDRSSSFGSRSRFSGSGSLFGSRGGSRSSKFDELSSSWQNLQRQLGTKERELHVAIQKQERYQSTVQDVTARMERVQQKLLALGISPFKDVERQLQDHKEAEQEIECIREDIARVKERGRQIMETTDPEGYQAMQATLAMLTDKIDNLQAIADDKAKQLQNAVKGQERHKIAMGAYKKHVKEIEDWLEEMKVRQAATPLATDSVGNLQQQLAENKDLQNQLNIRLQHVADLAIQCDNLCEMETPDSADKLRSQLATLQQNLGNLKLAAIEKQAPLRTAIKESEKRNREMADYEKNVKNLQKWISDTKMLAQAPLVPEQASTAMTPMEKQELQQQLQSDLFQHRNLVRQLSSEMKTREMRPQREATLPHVFTPLTEDDIQPRWEALSKELTQKKEQLEDLIQKSSELIGPRKYGRPGYGQETTTAQLGDIRRHLGALNDLWKQLQVQVDSKQLRLEKALEFQQRYQDALHNVSSWLDLAEQKLFSPDSNLNSEEKVKENENIQREIKSLQGEILAMGNAAQELLAVANTDSHDLIRQSLGNLNDRVHILESQARDQGDKLRSVDRNYKLYKDELENLEGKMVEARDMMASPGPSAPLQQRVNKMQKIEGQMKKCESQLEQLKKRQAEIASLDPEIISPYEMDALQSNFMDLQRKVMEKKASLQESVSVQEQYEKLLQDYADFLETADCKLKTEQITAKDLDSLKQQLIAHKDFFSDLEVHRAMLDSLVSQCDKATKQKHLPQHTRLSNLTYVLLDKASLHGQRLDRLVRQWAEMEEKFNQLQRFLDDIETQIPKPIANDDNLQTIQSKINTYQRLQRELTDEKPTVFQVVDKGKQLLHSINCPVLEMQVTDLAEKWVNLNTTLSHELKKSQSLGDQLQVFEAEASILKSWLTAARSKLNSLKQLSSTDLKSIATVRGKIDKILEFRKDVESQQPLKEKVMTIGAQLLQNKCQQTNDLEDRMRFLEHEWAHLEHDINKSEEYLHQAQMDLLPSRQALGELNAWLTEIEETLHEEKTKPLRNLADMEVLLKKYKSYKIDLSSKQLTVDFVNQDVLQPSDEMDTPPSAERTEFSERLGYLNSRWKEVSKHVSDRLASLEAVHNKWEEFEKSVTRLIGWFHEQEDRLKKYRLIGHEVSVRQTLKDVKGLKTTMKAKQLEIQEVRELGELLVQLSEDSPQVKKAIQTHLGTVEQQKRELDSNVEQVHKLLEDILGHWDSYHGELQAVSQTLAETEYCLQRYNLIGGDIATLKIQVDKLEHLMADMERHVARYEKFSNLANRLSQVCEAPTRKEINKTQSDIEQRWQNLFSELRTRTDMFRACLQQWLMYEEEYNAAKMWLDAKEKLCDELLYGKEERVRRDANLNNCQALLKDLDNYQSRLANLYRVGENVTKNMDPTSLVNITSKLSGLEQRVLSLRQKLAKHVQSLQGDLSQQRRFQEAFENVKAFVSQAQRILSMEDPNKSADKQALSDRLEHLKELASQFSDNSTQLDSLNDLGYRLALNETAAADLQHLNHKWHDLFAETKERCKSLQGMLLIQQDFAAKCDTWMTFLAQTEADLSTEITGNLIDLRVQQKKCDKFEAEMYSRQQILHSIISDGQTMMNEGDIDNKEEFQQKLHLLADQWQSVVRRANQRKAIIDSTIKQWFAFNDMTEKLRGWLREKEEGLQVFNFDTASLQKIKNLVEKAKQTQNEFKLQEDLFKNMNSQGKQLLQRADNEAQEELKVSMAQIQQHWHQIFVKLDGEREKLESVLRQWQECEDDIEDILTWLKDTRKSLGSSLPTAYEDLQADMHKCKDIEVAFANAEPKRQALLALEKKLAKTIEPEDLNVLHQRIRLLNKQWDELRNQASLRAQRIDDNMFRWSNFSEKLKDLCDWMDRMEVKVISTKDYHIEDLLNRMQKDFKDELKDKEKTKDELVAQGKALIIVSNEVRASDIEQKILRLEDKWEHLKAVIGFRQRKLQETLLAVQQLDVSMSNLRRWLADMENELSTHLVYRECDRKEIQRKLQHQSELQNDIERHSPGVGSVLNLCEVLLHDSDACPTDVEFNGLQTAMKTLERRWRHICQRTPELRTRIEETWQQWQTLIDDCRLFGDWLKVMESEVRDVEIDQADVSMTKEEFSRCETVQRKIHENLAKLENINRQYRHLAREGRTDTAGTLKGMMQDANDRWDSMQGRMSANLRLLRHSASIREDFKTTRESLLNWLTEIDMQLTTIEGTSAPSEIPGRVREMQRIQEEFDARIRKFKFLDEAGLYLIQKGDSSDAIATQAELDDFKQYHRQVLDKIAINNARLSALQTEQRFRLDEDELDKLERELHSLGPDEPLSLQWDMKEIEAYLESSPPESPPMKRRALLQKLRERSRSRSHSPKKLPSVTAATTSTASPERRPTRPLSPRRSSPTRRTPSPTRSRSPTRSLRTKSPRRVARDYVDSRAHSPSRQERFNRMKTELNVRAREAEVEEILEKLADALEDATEKLDMAERDFRTATPTRRDRRPPAYLQSVNAAERSVDNVRRIQRVLKAETGLQTIASADSQVRAVVERMELLKASAIQHDYRLDQHRKDWSQFNTDLDNMLSWLDEAEALQHSHKPLPGEITKLDQIIRQHKDFLVQLEAKKPRVISINLTSHEVIDHTTEEGRQLKDKLRILNKRWDAICSQATRLQGELQQALMQCQEFHHTIHDLLLWLEGIETRLQQCEPINMENDDAALWGTLRKLRDIKYDLEKNQPRVMSLRDTADQLLINSESPEMSQAKDKMHIIANRLKSLLRLCSSYISSLETRLESRPKIRSPNRSLDMSSSSLEPGSPRDPSIRTSTPNRPLRTFFRPVSTSSPRQRTRSPFALSRQSLAAIPSYLSGLLRPFKQRSDWNETTDLDTLTALHDESETEARCCPAFLYRVLRLALPLQLLLLLLLLLIWLVPLTEDDYNCLMANNFRRSLHPMLRYTDGPPPV